MEKKVTIAAAGDALILNRMPDYPGREELTAFLRQSDVSLVNLETTLTDGTLCGAARSGGTWLTSRPEVARDLQELGFDLLAVGNNHTHDYGEEGVRQTVWNLRNMGIAHCGAGCTLYEAARPAILETPHSRVAVLQVCSTCHEEDIAGRQSESMPGRPGLAPLRFTTEYTVNAGHMQALREIAAGTYMNGWRAFGQQQGYVPEDAPGTFSFGDLRFVQGEPEGKHTRACPEDLRRTREMIQSALLQAEYCVVMVHSHEIPRDQNDEPEEFLIEFAHACIEAGACAVVGSGTHELKGIEIYRGRPIFYCLGNFVFQNNFVERLPADYVEEKGLPLTLTGGQAFSEVGKRARCSLQQNRSSYQTVVPRFSFSGEKLTEIRMLPVSLQPEERMTYATWPAPAGEEESREICRTLVRLSAPFGTKMEWKEDGCIYIQLKEE